MFIPVFMAAAWTVTMFSGCIGQNGRYARQEAEGQHAGLNAEGQANISFDTTVHDFGTIIEGERIMCYFSYGNTGDADLLISRVEASCGCTSPDWSKEPLKPGDSETLKIMFDASGRSGAQRKNIVVYSNADPHMVTLTIKAEVRRN